ncbi:MAG: hypothetical protein KDA59_04660 [Planctomycetales bacterium]|nr:hypothetical protein [Planctomycetales bacterium]
MSKNIVIAVIVAAIIGVGGTIIYFQKVSVVVETPEEKPAPKPEERRVPHGSFEDRPVIKFPDTKQK